MSKLTASTTKPPIINGYRCIDFRHKIVHLGRDMTVLNFDRVPPQEPLFAKKEVIEKFVDAFVTYVNALHEQTMKVG